MYVRRVSIQHAAPIRGTGIFPSPMPLYVMSEELKPLVPACPSVLTPPDSNA